MKTTTMSNQSKIYLPQRLSRFNGALLIRSVDFPIYYLECLSERHFIIAGGGGSSKTGVHNQINILELIPTDSSCATELILKYHTPDEIPDAIMAGSLMRELPIVNTSFVTTGSSPTIYNLSFDSKTKSFSLTNYELLKDKSSLNEELKSVRCIPNRILGGSVNGVVTIWDVANRDDKKIINQFKAHTKEIDEIDVNLAFNQVVTLSRDEARCAIWDLTNFKLLKEFKKEDICNPNQKFCYRSCRFAYDRSSPVTDGIKTSSINSFLFVVCNAVPSKGASKLYKWSTNDYKKPTSINIKSDGVMAMTVSLGGKYVAVGTRSGAVSIFEAKNLKQIYQIEGAHHNAVTNLEFLTPISESLYLTNSNTCPLLSVSIDRRIVLHRPNNSTLILDMFKMLLMVLVIYIIFLVLYRNYSY